MIKITEILENYSGRQKMFNAVMQIFVFINFLSRVFIVNLYIKTEIKYVSAKILT